MVVLCWISIIRTLLLKTEVFTCVSKPLRHYKHSNYFVHVDLAGQFMQCYIICCMVMGISISAVKCLHRREVLDVWEGKKKAVVNEQLCARQYKIFCKCKCFLWWFVSDE